MKTFLRHCVLFLNDTGNKRKGGALLENLCIVGILLALGRFTNNQMLLFYGWSPNSLCSPLLNVSIAMYFISINPVYLFLWVRQVSMCGCTLQR